MKKKLNEASIVNELRGESAYFPNANVAETATATEGEAEEEQITVAAKPRKRSLRAAKAPPTADLASEPAMDAMATFAADLPASAEIDNTTAPQQMVEGIRKAVKRLGKEATFCRFTQEEKNALADIIYTYKRSGIRTSENEVIRIAVNWLLENYHSDGKNSVLASVLERLNA